MVKVYEAHELPKRAGITAPECGDLVRGTGGMEWGCSLAQGHRGPHVALSLGDVCAWWDRDEPDLEPDLEPGQLLTAEPLTPWPAPEGEPPATLRDWFAGLALQGAVALGPAKIDPRWCYEAADAMLAARRKGGADA